MTLAASRRVYIATFGCQMNDYDSARMLRLLAPEGYEQTALPKEADLIILNTCSVRDKAEQKALSLLGRLKKLRRTRPRLKFVLAGCFAQRDARSLLAKYEYLDLVMGPDAVPRLPHHLRTLAQDGGRIVDVDLSDKYLEDDCELAAIIPGKGSPISAFVTIMRGCDNFCAYCIVPYVRGRERSRGRREILTEIEHLTKRGVREVTLLGQNVNSYGHDLDEKTDFPELLRLVHQVPGLQRLRFTTSHPKDLSDSLIHAFAELPKLADHLHLPLQSGSDSILARMGRGYTVAEYLTRVEKLRRVRPNLAITTDLLVGFPGESAADFHQTLAVLDEVRYSNAFSFRYSVRPGTAAAGLPDDVPEKEKIARLMELQARQRDITFSLHREMIGRQVEVLVERSQPGNQRFPFSGKSGCYREIHLRGDGIAIGDMVKVQCHEAFANHLLGIADAGEGD